jgi:hypothetical protein
MACKLCSSDQQRRFSTEMNIHFPPREGLEKPSVPASQEIIVCLKCGFAEFTLPEAPLRKLTDHDSDRFRSL